MGDLTRVSLSIDEKLLEKLEAMAQDSGYQNRSEFIRDLIRERMTNIEWQSGRDVLGTLTVIYCHHQRGLTEKLVMPSMAKASIFLRGYLLSPAKRSLRS